MGVVDRGDHGAQRNRREPQIEPAGFDGAEVQQIGDEAEQVAALRFDRGAVAQDGLAIRKNAAGRIAQQLGAAQDRLQRGAQLVAEKREEFGLGPVGGLGAFDLERAARLDRLLPRQHEPARDEDGKNDGDPRGRAPRRIEPVVPPGQRIFECDPSNGS